jgi:uncharacterized protein YkwD
MANPTAREQELLELVNRMRMAPAAELDLLLNSFDPNIRAALTYFNVNLDTLRTQWRSLTAAAPLAWSSQLNDVAFAHNQKMIQYDQQSHQVGVYDASGNLVTPYEPNIGGRITAGGYSFTNAGENIFAYARSILDAHGSFAIDWGGSPATGGIQDPAGHRNNMMSSNYRELGISITDETNPSTQVGPLVVTQDFGNRSALSGKAWLLGVVFQDMNRDGWYQAGEGRDIKVNIKGINGTTFSDTINVGDTGSYQDLLNPGQYQVDFLRNGVVMGSKTATIDPTTPNNVKIDLVLPVLTPATRTDFNGDLKSDILFRNTNGNVALWQMNGSTVTPSLINPLSSDWTIAGTGDFNGDAKNDILLRNTNGSVSLWQMNGSTITQGSAINSLSSDWTIAGTADFNGDGNADILLRNTNGNVATWQMNGSAITRASTLGVASADWTVAGTADFNGDGKADILLSKADGTVALWQVDGSAVVNASTVSTLGAGWSIAATGDFNGDGKADIMLRNTNGNIAEWQMNGAKVTSGLSIGTATTDWKITGTGDFNGDGKADILWRNTDGRIATWQLNGASVLAAGLTSVQSDSSWNIAAPIG